uniref:Translation initiation factor IF-3 n=1 Tax=uncultured delta proteobacterium TaxID=34034 RepID=Q2YZU8_9DELT|nr:translation initiation factor IF-3 [uncultured delta proteobacterium]
MTMKDALEKAGEIGVDIVEVAANATPPVCKIMDYGKFKYEQNKQQQEAKKKQTIIQVKEVKIRPKTEEHDYQFKMRHIERFLADKNRVKVTIMFRGREIAYPQLGSKILDRIAEELKDQVNIDSHPKMEGRNMIMYISSKT